VLDISHHAVLRNEQIGDAVRRCRSKLAKGRNLAILGFDCCEMAMAEVWAEMIDGAEIGIASQAGVPYTSWAYAPFLEALLKKPTLKSDDVAKMLVEKFVKFYSKHPEIYVTASACSLNFLGNLEESVKPLVKALVTAAGDTNLRSMIFKARNTCPNFDPDGFVDFDCFCRFLQKFLPGTEVSEACNRVRSALKEFVTQAGFSPQDPTRMISLSKGLSIWFPPWIENSSILIPQKEVSEHYLQNGYQTTRWSRATGWNEFLLSMLH
jgi:hypothetical protein